jgi:hypothetical protein
MKLSAAVVFLFILLIYNPVVYSQKITLGLYSGTNFSDIHGQDFGGKWSSKPGPSLGLNIGYSFNKSLGIQTGIGYSTVYYEHKDYYPYQYFEAQPTYNSDIPTISYISETMDFNYLRIPFLFTVKIPTAIQVNLKAGLFLSYLKDYSSNTYYFYSKPDKPEKFDLGYIVSSGISYPVTDKLRTSLNASYLTGSKRFLNDHRYRNGYSEFTLGLEYSPGRKDKIRTDPITLQDSTTDGITVSLKGGFNVSWNPQSVDGKKYLPGFGPSAGLNVNFPLGREFFLVSGISFERKGYSIEDSSASFYSYGTRRNQMYNVDTKVQTDYAVLSALLRFPLGRSQRFYFSTGPWVGLKIKARNIGVAYYETHSGGNYSFYKYTVYDDLERLIKNDDMGWLFNSGISLLFYKQYKIDLALQFSTGFKDVFDRSFFTSQQPDATNFPEIRNRTLSFLIAFTIPHANH